MELKNVWLTPSAEVEFTPEEADYLVLRAQRHYDSDCQAAGSSYEDGARENGFIKRLKLFPGKPHVWSSRQIDLTLKVLEHYAGADDPMRRKLFKDLHKTYTAMQTKYKELNGDR